MCRVDASTLLRMKPRRLKRLSCDLRICESLPGIFWVCTILIAAMLYHSFTACAQIPALQRVCPCRASFPSTVHHQRHSIDRWVKVHTPIDNRRVICAASHENPSESQDEVDAQSAPGFEETPSRGLPLALGAVALGAAVFIGLRGGSQAVNFDTLQSGGLPLEQALSNHRPTVIEFYASWRVDPPGEWIPVIKYICALHRAHEQHQ